MLRCKLQQKENYLQLFATSRDKLLRVTCPSQPERQFCENKPIIARLLLAGDFKLAVEERDVNSFQQAPCKLGKILKRCGIPSATSITFQSSSLRCKLQEKLPRVTLP